MALIEGLLQAQAVHCLLALGSLQLPWQCVLQQPAALHAGQHACCAAFYDEGLAQQLKLEGVGAAGLGWWLCQLCLTCC